MEEIINGGIYRSDLNEGNENNFSGINSATMIQTFGENNVYLIIPFTSFGSKKKNSISEGVVRTLLRTLLHRWGGM